MTRFPIDPFATRSPNKVRLDPAAPKQKPVTSSARMLYLKAMHKLGYNIYFRYPLWNYWIYVTDPCWLPEVHYLTMGREQPTIANRRLERISRGK